MGFDLTFGITVVWEQYIRKGKERKRTCIAPIVSISTTKRSDVGHTELPANTPQRGIFDCDIVRLI